MKDEEQRSTAAGYAGFAVYGACVAGLLGLLAGFAAFLTGPTDPQHYIGAGVCLAAAALAFGLLANAVLRR